MPPVAPEDLDRPALDRRQADKLAALLRAILPHNPFLARKFAEAGLRPEDIRSPTDLMRLPFTTIDVICAGGAVLLSAKCRGSSTTRPFVVENHSRPSTVLQPAGCNPSEHFNVGKPSASPKVRKKISLNAPSAQRFNSALFTRMTPACELIQ